ncbi:hypothetical protein [Roseovarius nubinhibens]|uniref:Uncharacterized protein n=1 Tax=Roseovarius nubinhibens TaxID=314263 RepID=A0A348WB15_9RHOB|nr:hypothetical protein [Roseovarius nubinhibens]|tara:strand:- start:130 stop:558 length:429 start_codon:yes stop_codon:yes gene_type:complete
MAPSNRYDSAIFTFDQIRAAIPAKRLAATPIIFRRQINRGVVHHQRERPMRVDRCPVRLDELQDIQRKIPLCPSQGCMACQLHENLLSYAAILPHNSDLVNEKVIRQYFPITQQCLDRELLKTVRLNFNNTALSVIEKLADT